MAATDSDGSCIHRKRSSPKADLETGAKRRAAEAENQWSSAAPSVAVQSLVKMLSSRSSEVRLAAFEAFRHIGSCAIAEVGPIGPANAGEQMQTEGLSISSLCACRLADPA